MSTRRTCPACSRYAYNRCRYCGWVRAIVRPPDHKRRIVMGVRLTATGVREHKTMSSRKAAQVLGGQKGGLRSAAGGKAHRWTSESARKAALKSWKGRKFNKRIGARVGMKVNKRKGLWREPLRAYYAENPTRGIRYIPETKQWARANGQTPAFVQGWLESAERCISERAALQALGHLASPRGYIPDSITPVHHPSRKDGS